MIETHILLGLSIFLFIALILVTAGLLDSRQNDSRYWKIFPINSNAKEIINRIVDDIGQILYEDFDHKLYQRDRTQVKESVEKLLTGYFSASKNVQIPSNTFYRFAFQQDKDITDLKQSHETEWDKLHSFAAFLSLCNDYSDEELQVMDHVINFETPGIFSKSTAGVAHKEELGEVLELIHTAEKQYIQEHKSDIINKAKNNLLTQCITTKPVNEKVEKLREIVVKEHNRGTDSK